MTPFSLPVHADITTIWNYQDNVILPLKEFPSVVTLSPGVAVVICTYKRADSLRRFLDSLREQTLLPDQLIIVDASPDDATEKMLRNYGKLGSLATTMIYTRVTGSLRGLTRQRNLGARLVTVDKLAYFDDDVVLFPDCLEKLVGVYQQYGESVAGVGAYVVNAGRSISLRWKIRRWLRIVPSLEPGRYFRSGMSTPWSFLEPNEGGTYGDWLPGCAMMWRTSLVSELGFNERFVRYANGEDLEFSLRAKKLGKLLLAGSARLCHLHDSSGRLDQRELSRTTAVNNLAIFEGQLPNRTCFDYSYFFYGYFINMLLEQLGFLRARQPMQAFRSLQGHFEFVLYLLRRGKGC